MDELVRWLGVQLDEDERIARRACEYASPEWHLDDDTGETVLWWPPEPHVAENERKHGLRVTADVWRGMTIDASGQQIAPHIAAHDPARVLREIDGKRRTLIRCQEAMFAASPMLVHFARQTLREMALSFSDRPGYERAVAE
ncbi:DUF6221 family protein [Streptomyces sp. FL07-04A]|uniref:DUF6221 family protein n=1 Tax=Streptomyces sp. FL07-04A TaxID=3028658 RepID=UPI0029B07B68|nr:DUF6221 family protein [Streptomyces sp. FL07-04A]MDX3575950.1 DUF6221 family protein [Streptomyces sp. FL07-04A]